MRVCLALVLALGSVPAAAEAAAFNDIVFKQELAGPATSFPATFSPRVVESWNTYVRNGIVKSFRNHGEDIDPNAANVSTTLATFGDHQVLKSRAEVSSKLFLYQYAGVVGPNVVIVLCSSKAAHPFEATGSECEQQAAKVFEAR